MKTKINPEFIDISPEQLDSIKLRLTANNLLEEDKKIILTMISAYGFIMHQLQRAKISIKKLKKFFGFASEKRKKKKTNDLDLSLENMLCQTELGQIEASGENLPEMLEGTQPLPTNALQEIKKNVELSTKK